MFSSAVSDLHVIQKLHYSLPGNPVDRSEVTYVRGNNFDLRLTDVVVYLHFPCCCSDVRRNSSLETLAACSCLLHISNEVLITRQQRYPFAPLRHQSCHQRPGYQKFLKPLVHGERQWLYLTSHHHRSRSFASLFGPPVNCSRGIVIARGALQLCPRCQCCILAIKAQILGKPSRCASLKHSDADSLS